MLRKRFMRLGETYLEREEKPEETSDKVFLGVYDYTVILTYLSLASSIAGMFFSIEGFIYQAVFCLALSGLFDMFDGKVARTKKNRTEDEKNFGIQIDSLCDVVCFGVLPVMISYQMGMKTPVGIVVLIFYCLCGMIRLGHFNVVETSRQHQTSAKRTHYQGLPITSISVLFPFMVLFASAFPMYAASVHRVFMFGVGLMFVTDFSFRKPNNRELAAIVVVVAAVVFGILLGRYI